MQQLNEYIMISLRTMEGIDLDFIAEQFGKAYVPSITAQSKKYIDSGKLLRIENRLVLTNEGKLFADGIAADLFV